MANLGDSKRKLIRLMANYSGLCAQRVSCKNTARSDGDKESCDVIDGREGYKKRMQCHGRVSRSRSGEARTPASRCPVVPSSGRGL